MRLVICGISAAFALAGCGGAEEENGSTATGSAVMNGAPPTVVPAPANPMPTNAQQYVALASAGDMFEIQAARIALQKARSDQVKGLAQMILSDHQRSSTQLAAAGARSQPPLAPTPVLSPSQQTAIEALQRAQGDAFDREWLRQQVVAHQQALDLATAYAGGGDSEPVRGQAAATIAPIQTHLTRARLLESEALAADATDAPAKQRPAGN